MSGDVELPQWQLDLVFEAMAILDTRILPRLSSRIFTTMRPEQLESCVDSMSSYTDDDLKLLASCITQSFTSMGHLFVNVENLRQGDLIRYAVEAIPVVQLYYSTVNYALRSQMVLNMLRDDCVMVDGVPALPLECTRGRVIEAFAGYDITRASVEHLIWLGQNADRLSRFSELLEARRNVSREFCEQLLGLETPALADGLL